MVFSGVFCETSDLCIAKSEREIKLCSKEKLMIWMCVNSETRQFIFSLDKSSCIVTVVVVVIVCGRNDFEVD